jgi:hypothetical protein
MSITTAGRSLSANMVTEVSASQLSPILLASFSFSTPVRLWSGYGTITVGSVTYQGIGTLGTISPVEETTDLAARGINFQLSGIPSAYVSLALTENYQGKACSVLFGALDATGALVSSPSWIFAGRVKCATPTRNRPTCTRAILAWNSSPRFRKNKFIGATPSSRHRLTRAAARPR